MSDEKPKKRMGLGRGLDALLGDAIRGDSTPPVSAVAADNVTAIAPSNGTSSILVADIHPNPHQPRKHFAVRRGAI